MIFENFFAKFIEDSFKIINPTISSTTFADVIIMLFWSISLSILIAITYRGTHKSISYSQNFTQTLVLLGVIVSFIMLIIGSDIARAFTLVGALSIVRFRNAIKETRDVGFIFFTMAVGMACGTRFYIVAMILAITGSLLMYFMFVGSFGQKGLAQDIIEMNIPAEEEYSKLLNPIFNQYLKFFSILSVDSINDKLNRISFVVTFKRKSPIFRFKNKDLAKDLDFKSQLLYKIQELGVISEIKVINGFNSTEI
ncbi:MAG: DUF4956 domain-containing protein [Promethearchaeota archaeon]